MVKSKRDFLRTIIDKLEDVDTSLADDALSAAEFNGYIDTGSFSLNALLSGSIYGGVPNSKSVVFAGESSTGKTYFVLGIVKHYLDSHPDSGVIYYDTESTIDRKMLLARNIDPTRIAIVNKSTVEEFRLHAMKFLEYYLASKDRVPMMMVLDSLGMLTSLKALADSIDEKKMGTRDMTLTQVIKGTMRILRLKMARAGIPMLITNHTYKSVGSWGDVQVMAGGSGIQYAADDIILLTKKKDKDESTKEVIGNIVFAKTIKSRNGRENQMVKVRVSYDSGLDQYYGLLDIAEKAGVLYRPRGKDFYLFGERKIPADEVESGKIFKETEILNAIDESAKKMFTYGNLNPVIDLVEEDEETVASA